MTEKHPELLIIIPFMLPKFSFDTVCFARKSLIHAFDVPI